MYHRLLRPFRSKRPLIERQQSLVKEVKGKEAKKPTGGGINIKKQERLHGDVVIARLRTARRSKYDTEGADLWRLESTMLFAVRAVLCAGEPTAGANQTNLQLLVQLLVVIVGHPLVGQKIKE